MPSGLYLYAINRVTHDNRNSLRELSHLTTCAAFMLQGHSAPSNLELYSCEVDRLSTLPFPSTALALSELKPCCKSCQSSCARLLSLLPFLFYLVI